LIQIKDRPVRLSHPATMHRMETALAAGAPWLLAALVSAEAGWLQMAQADRLGVICGSAPQGHCAACYLAAAFLALGALATVSAPALLKRRFS
jgi:hypothetical protein